MNVIAYSTELGPFHDARTENTSGIKPDIIYFDDLSIYDSILCRFNINPWDRKTKIHLFPKSDTYPFDCNDYWFDETDQLLRPVGELSDVVFLELKMKGVPIFPIAKEDHA